MPTIRPAFQLARRRRPAILAFSLTLLTSVSSLPLETSAQEAQEPQNPSIDAAKLEPLCVIPESYTMRPSVFVLVPGARRVGFTAARQTSTGLELYSRNQIRSLRLKWPDCYRKGQEAATRHLRTLKPTFTRDDRNIIQYARFQSEHPLTSSIFISPEFAKLFEDTLGKDLYVAIPDRSNVFVFPKLSNSIEKVTPKMAYLYTEALYPVSREVFELTNKGIRVVGEF